VLTFPESDGYSSCQATGTKKPWSVSRKRSGPGQHHKRVEVKMKSTATTGNGQSFVFRVKGVMFRATWDQVRVILASMDTATVTA